jgi:hypothetical protein
MHVAFRLVVGALLLVAALVVGCGHQPTETAPSRVETKDGPKGVVAGKRGMQIPPPPAPPPLTKQ